MFILLAELSGFSWSKKVLYQSCQGDYVKYSGDNIYCLSIYKQQNTISKKYFIFITAKGVNDYGHFLNIPIEGEFYENELQKTRVIWAAEGIELTFTTGHKIFVPKQAFIALR
jgi:hypothetical protein